jgi:hypothetical protein
MIAREKSVEGRQFAAKLLTRDEARRIAAKLVGAISSCSGYRSSAL